MRGTIGGLEIRRCGMDYYCSWRKVIASGDGPKERGVSQDKLCSRRIGLTTLLYRYGSIDRGVSVSARKRTVRSHVESRYLYHALELVLKKIRTE